MSNMDVDELGPVDYLVVEFPAGRSNFTGEMASELASLIDAGTVRLLDLLIVHKADDGTIEAFEIDDLDEVDELRALEGQIAEILAAEDVAHLAEAMENGSTAGVLVWGEHVGRALRLGITSVRWPVGGHRTHSDPGHPRVPGGRGLYPQRRRMNMPLRPARVARRAG